MGRMQIRGTNEAAPCLPSQFTLMMTNTFVHREGRWELQYASNHCPPEISPLLFLANPSSLHFLSFFVYHLLSFFNSVFFYFMQSVIFIFSSILSLSESLTARSKQMLQWFARGQCYLNRPIGLFAIAPSIRQEALRNQPITSISHDSIQWIYNGWSWMSYEIRWKQRERERERNREVGEDKRAKRWSVREGEAKSQRRVQFWSVSMTTMCGSVLFVYGLKQTSDCWGVRRWTVTLFDSKL